MAEILSQHIRKKRRFLPEDFIISDWQSLTQFVDRLLAQDISTKERLEHWLHDWSELEGVFSEEFAWRYIRMTCNTADPEKRKAYNDFVENFLGNFKTAENKLQKKLIDSPSLSLLDKEKYGIMVRTLQNTFSLFREENVAIQAKVQTLSQKPVEAIGAMDIEFEGIKYTLQQAAAFLEKSDRTIRESIWRKIAQRRMEDSGKIDSWFDELLALRGQIAQNADFENFTGFSFKNLGRFDYGTKECDAFHAAVEKEIKPIYENFLKDRKEKLKLDTLRPWDLSIDIFGDKPLLPFDNANGLIKGTRNIMNRLDPDFGTLFQKLENEKLLDLESRLGKAPGGYNYPLPEIGLSFIFMNAVGTLGDLVTMVHEAGHAVHAGLMGDLELNEFKNTPSEVAELASMSMELLTMEYWSEFFADKEELKRAWYEEISRTINLLPWIATVDCFQRWVYENSGHTGEERKAAWIRIFKRFHGDMVDWTGLETELNVLWQKQIHIFEVPFYYIEYGIAQLGAMAVWRNYKLNPQKALHDYKAALSLGYTKTIPELYATAGIRFDFSHGYISELSNFMLKELENLKA